jgi:hypothetical protein
MWMISDVDPLEVFSIANRTGNEIAISLTDGVGVDAYVSPAAYLEKLVKEPISSKVHEFNEADKQFAYILNESDLRAVIIQKEKGFGFRGDYPLNQESEVQSGIETILRSFELLEVEGWELSIPFGQRNEGFLTIGQAVEGYIPLAAMSVWTFEGEEGQKIEISIETGDLGTKLEGDMLEANLNLDMSDPDGKSIFPEGGLSLTNSYQSNKIILPESGNYTIRVSPLPDVRWWWGWYSIKLTN